MPSNPRHATIGRKSRRRHRNSRTGCAECKRRRVKCDEVKPSCTRCVLLLNKCLYSTAAQPECRPRKNELDVPLQSSNNPLGYTEPSRFPVHPYSALDKVDEIPTISDVATTSTNANVKHPYIQHGSHIARVFHSDYGSLYWSQSSLAKRCDSVIHSLLAVSAVNLAYNMIAERRAPETEAVQKVLLAGYWHYNQASQKMRENISNLNSTEREALVVSTFALVPFATASQQIHLWISSRRGVKGSPSLLSSTPRDVIIMLRGLRTTLETHNLCCADTTYGNVANKHLDLERTILKDPIASIVPNSRRTKVMTTMIVGSCEEAFSTLKERLYSLSFYERGSLDPCIFAFEVLEGIKNSAIHMVNPSQNPLWSLRGVDYLKLQATQFPVIASLLQSFLGASSEIKYVFPESELLTHLILSFYAQVPQAYLDIVLPLLDQRLENRKSASTDHETPNLTSTQAFALDIYAHWSVLMFLVQDESWWIGTLPTVTLEGMLNRYGDRFVSGLWPGQALESFQWWPGSMLNMVQNFHPCT